VPEQPLTRGLRALGIELAPEQVDACAWLASELISWNRRVNLTAITGPSEVQVKHLLDSLTLVPLLRRLSPDPERLVDVGSGAGFPALPLKIALPGLEIVVVEATGKKVAFLEHVIRELGLEGIQVVHDRAETVAHDPMQRERFDLAVARGVGRAPVLTELLLPFVQVGGWAVLMKNRAGLEAEVASAVSLHCYSQY
jgi:16S rRNA (guanine527-N7)-methyltransferase